MLCDYERKRSDMKKITIDNTEYVVYGNNEKKDNLKPHIEVAETGIVPEGKQRGLLLLYLEEKGIEPIQGATTYWCINKILKLDNLKVFDKSSNSTNFLTYILLCCAKQFRNFNSVILFIGVQSYKF